MVNAAQWPGADQSAGTVSYLVPAAEDRVSEYGKRGFLLLLLFCFVFLMLWTPATNQALRDSRSGKRRPVLWLLPYSSASLLLTPEILISSMPCNVFPCFLCSFHLRKVFQSVPTEGAGFLPRQFCLRDFAISSTDTNQLTKEARLLHSDTAYENPQ